jgi:negative regulator of flagellin synthesis FlgM
MTIKNVTSSPVGNANVKPSKDSDKSKSPVVAELTNPTSVGQIAAAASASNKNYGVELSEKGRSRAAEQKKALDIAKNTPDIREDRVAALKAKIQAGTYEIDSGKIADGMLREAIMEHLATNKDN